MDQIQKDTSGGTSSSEVRKQTSMGTLIIWNITKAMEANPNIDLKSAIKAAQERLQQDAGSALASGNQEEQYLTCALLAWQQLGHSDDEHLYQFVETKRQEFSEKKSLAEKMSRVRKPEVCPGSFISYDSVMSKGTGSSSYDSSYPMGPVVKLPRIVDTKIVMRVDSKPARPANRKPPDKELKNRIDAACCMDSACIKKLNELDKATAELRGRAQRLARREAERVELLERAEAAWKELELGYQRRLALAEEKEDDMAKHIKKMIEERNEYKNACTTLAVQLQERGDAAENERAKLTQLENEVCEYASQRLRVSQEAAKLDAQLAEQQCKGAQVDRDLQFKEEQTRRKLQTTESELEGMRVLTCEAERALHAELHALRAQVAEVSRQLLEEDAEIEQIRGQLDTLRQEKSGLVEDLDGCNAMCDLKLQDKMEELKKKREVLGELKEKVMECQCKMPADASVQVKRTPSLAVLCKCTPEDKSLHSCSCTSLRTTLLTNLLEDLFGGLQSELGGCTAEMPCRLLKCFEDKHNWDKSSVVKTNLRNYFSRLLIGELDIAIATSIEKYHAKWVGASCADAARMIPDRGGPENEGWEERVIERRAHKLASKLAEQLFEERAVQLTARAKEIVSTGPPPCECSPQPSKAAPAIYPCLVNQPVARSDASSPTWRSNASSAPTYWRRTQRDVVQLRVQLDDLKKDSIKKEDLKIMEENIVKLVQRATVTENVITESAKEKEKQKNEVHRKDNAIPKAVNTEHAFKHNASNKLSSIKKKQFDSTPKKNNKNILLGLQMEKPVQSYKNTGRSYAVNLCLCGPHKDKKCKKSDPANLSQESKKQIKAEATRVIVPQVLSKNQNKNMDSQLPVLDRVIEKRYKNSTHPPCPSHRICFHKPPSNTSIDKLLETLVKWKCDLSNFYGTINPDNDKTRDSSPNTEIGSEYKDIISDIKMRKEPEKVMFKDVSTKFPPIESYAPFKSSVVVANISKSTEYPSEMPANTESVYMGAINLDKSNDNMCKCISEVRNELEQTNEPKPTILKCMNSKSCSCGKSECKNILDTNILKRSFGTDNKRENMQKGESSVQTESKMETDRNHIVKTSTLFPSDCEYCIKFLGVTLTNASSSKVLAEKENDPKPECTTDKCNKKRNNHSEVWYNNVDMHSSSKPPTHLPSCSFGVKNGENKDILTNAVTKQHGDFCKSKDKSLNTQNFRNITNKQSCVCCNANKLDGSKDLEVNAFQLLEEYLREKIDEFKLTNCKSDCIPSEEEEKMFNVILEKVKKIITANTSSVACKCDSQGVAKGSWQRAYMLLQEYLKIKIKRVQCFCLSTNDNKDAVLPNVMEKVSNLIDNDFQRLKEICKCQKISEGTAPSMNTDHPVKDHCHIQDDQTNTSNEFQRPEKISKEISNRSLIVTQNISSQITPNIETKPTSCDIIKMTNQLTDTEHTNECYRIPKLNYDHRFSTNSTKSTDAYVKMFGTNNVFDNNQCINVSHEVKEVSFAANMEVFHDLDLLAPHNNSNTDLEKMPGDRKSAPYIGFTLECHCANSALGTCTCTKTMSSGNNLSGNTINTIWNTSTSRKQHHHDTSYIMDSVPNKSSTEINDPQKTRNTIGPMVPNKITCGTVSSLQDCEELVLKDSETKMNKTFLSTMTSSEDVRYADFNENADSCTDASNTCDDTLFYQTRSSLKRGTDDAVGNSEHLARSLSSNCDCNMVPMCHVKMLVENIENKLIHSRCTCDSLSSKICPVHSKKP